MTVMGLMRTAAILAVCTIAVGCHETPESRYPTAAAAATAGAFQRGWLPEVLQPDATDIYETHDIDSNRGHGTFAANPHLIHRLDSDCVRESAAEFRCKSFLVSIDVQSGKGKFQLNR